VSARRRGRKRPLPGYRLYDFLLHHPWAHRWLPRLTSLGFLALGLATLLPVAHGVLAAFFLLLHGRFTVPPHPVRLVLGVLDLIFAATLLLRSRLFWLFAVVDLVGQLVVLAVVHHALPRPLEQGAILVLLFLVLSSPHFRRTSLASGTVYAFTSVVFLLAYASFGSLALGRQFHPAIRSLVTALYFSVVTLSTVGYGDIVPATAEARLFVVSIIVLGVVLFTTAFSAIILPIFQNRVEKFLMPADLVKPYHDHFVLTGNSSLARNAFRELSARGQTSVFVHPEPFTIPGYDKLEIVLGDPTDVDTLRKARVEYARAVLALGEDDSENAFIVLAVREFAEHVKTIAAVNNSRNMARIRRVHPDVIVAPQVLGGQVLAMHLSGESMEDQSLLSGLLQLDADAEKT
jgi:voltage-gated potassium channel